jgi:hypothetical protein
MPRYLLARFRTIANEVGNVGSLGVTLRCRMATFGRDQLRPVPGADLELPVVNGRFIEAYFVTEHCPLRQTADCGTAAPAMAQWEISALVHVRWRS